MAGSFVRLASLCQWSLVFINARMLSLINGQGRVNNNNDNDVRYMETSNYVDLCHPVWQFNKTRSIPRVLCLRWLASLSYRLKENKQHSSANRASTETCCKYKFERCQEIVLQWEVLYTQRDYKHFRDREKTWYTISVKEIYGVT